jgi:hypothetical protein
MDRDKNKPSPEREQTDESLRVEREKADQVLEEVVVVDETADAVTSRARARADEVLEVARAKTDRQSAARPTRVQPPEIIKRERMLEDEVLRADRASADEVLREERAEHVALLSRERGETDKDLSNERARSDEAVATRDEFMKAGMLAVTPEVGDPTPIVMEAVEISGASLGKGGFPGGRDCPAVVARAV